MRDRKIKRGRYPHIRHKNFADYMANKVVIKSLYSFHSQMEDVNSELLKLAEFFEKVAAISQL